MSNSAKSMGRWILHEFFDLEKRKIMNFKNRNTSIQFNASTSSTQDEIEEFTRTFPNFVKDLTSRLHIPEVSRYYEEMFNYAILPGIQTAELTTLEAYKLLEKSENLTRENMELASILGWCTELFKTFISVYEDIVNNSEKRNGNLCWHKLHTVGLNAINDGCLMEQGIYFLLEKHFKNRHFYLPASKLFRDATMYTFLGRIFENILVKKQRPQFELFTPTNYNSLAIYKTYYIFHIPITLAMYLSHTYNMQLDFQVREILAEVGHFYHVQKNYNNCFDESSEEDNDIVNGKCTWLALTALEKADPGQKVALKKHYGSANSGSIKVIKNIYRELKLPEDYNVYKQKSYDKIQGLVTKVSQQRVQELSFKVTQTVYV